MTNVSVTSNQKGLSFLLATCIDQKYANLWKNALRYILFLFHIFLFMIHVHTGTIVATVYTCRQVIIIDNLH